MLNIILNTIGLIFIVYGVFTIKKDFSMNKGSIEDLILIEERIKEYYALTEDSIENFHEIIDTKLEKINNQGLETPVEHAFQSKIESKLISNKNDLDTSDINLNEFHNKVLELSNIGLNSEEIAKRLNKGKREIEIILKIYNGKKISKTI